jgi:hypothetical protein
MALNNDNPLKGSRGPVIGYGLYLLRLRHKESQGPLVVVPPGRRCGIASRGLSHARIHAASHRVLSRRPEPILSWVFTSLGCSPLLTRPCRCTALLSRTWPRGRRSDRGGCAPESRCTGGLACLSRGCRPLRGFRPRLRGATNPTVRVPFGRSVTGAPAFRRASTCERSGRPTGVPPTEASASRGKQRLGRWRLRLGLTGAAGFGCSSDDPVTSARPCPSTPHAKVVAPRPALRSAP